MKRFTLIVFSLSFPVVLSIVIVVLSSIGVIAFMSILNLSVHYRWPIPLFLLALVFSVLLGYLLRSIKQKPAHVKIN